jgi:lipoprotein NlpI
VKKQSAELLAYVAKGVAKKWPYPVLELYLNKRSPADTLGAARNRDERCEAHFYIGQWHILRGNKARAKAALQTAVNVCPKLQIEYPSAVAELRRLNEVGATSK